MPSAGPPGSVCCRLHDRGPSRLSVSLLPAKNIPTTTAAPNIPTTTASHQRPQSHLHLNQKLKKIGFRSAAGHNPKKYFGFRSDADHKPETSARGLRPFWGPLHPMHTPFFIFSARRLRPLLDQKGAYTTSAVCEEPRDSVRPDSTTHPSDRRRKRESLHAKKIRGTVY